MNHRVFVIGPLSATSSGGMAAVAATLERHSPTATFVDSGAGGRPTKTIAALLEILCARPDLLHLNVASGKSTWRKSSFAALASLLSIPYVIHLHGATYDTWLRGLNGVSRLIVRRLFARASAVIVLGARWREFVLTEFGLQSARVRIVHNGSDDLGYDESLKQRLIAFLGPFSDPRKGGDTLLSALALVRWPPEVWTVAICGYADQVAEVHVPGCRIDWKPYLDADERKDLLRKSEIYVQASLAEGLSIALLEALSAGCEVVATDVGSTRDAVTQEFGELVPAGDHEALAASLSSLVRRSSGGPAGRPAARERWEASFSGSRHAEAVEQVWRQVLSARVF